MLIDDNNLVIELYKTITRSKMSKHKEEAKELQTKYLQDEQFQK